VLYSGGKKEREMKARILTLACALLLVAALLPAAEKLGDITYLEGEVTVLRNSEELDGVQVGLDIQNFDVMKTGPDGLAEIAVATAKAPRMTIKVSPGTQFSFEISKVGGKQHTTVGLISGTVSLKVAKLTGAQSVNVKSDAAAMGVRGTQFTVTSPPTGDILVTCDEGEVTCTDDEGRELAALPGTVVEKRPNELFRTVPVAVSSLETFRKNWNAERIEALRANALRAIRDLASLYVSLSRDFNANYAELKKRQAVLSKWQEEDRKGKTGGAMDVMREKKEIVRHLFALRRTLFKFERVYFRLLELKDYHDQGFGRGTIAAGETTTQFFQKLEREKKDMLRKMAVVRYVTKLYALRNDGMAPTGASDEEQESDQAFFDD
jgi:hypothetical protein